MRFKNKLGGALAALAVATAIMGPAASARPVFDRPTPVATCDPSAVPPPPSSIAASAAKEYELLRSCGAQAEGTTAASAPITREPSPPSGFDWLSAAIGGIVAAGLSLALAAAVGMRRRTGRPRRAAFSG
jgi:hypothetical protein